MLSSLFFCQPSSDEPQNPENQQNNSQNNMADGLDPTSKQLDTNDMDFRKESQIEGDEHHEEDSILRSNSKKVNKSGEFSETLGKNTTKNDRKRVNFNENKLEEHTEGEKADEKARTINVEDVKAHQSETKPEEKKNILVDTLDDDDNEMSHAEFSKENIVENFNSIRDCVQVYKEIYFDELRDLDKKRTKNFAQVAKRGKPEDDDSNLHQNDDKLKDPKQDLLNTYLKKQGGKDADKQRSIEQKTMITHYANTDIEKMKNEVKELKRAQARLNDATKDTKTLNLMLLRDDIDCAGRRVQSLKFPEKEAQLENLLKAVEDQFGQERSKVSFQCFNKKFDSNSVNIFTQMDSQMKADKDSSVYMMMLITTCHVPKFSKKFFPLKCHVEIDINSIMNQSQDQSQIDQLDNIYNRNIKIQELKKQIQNQNKMLYKKITDYEHSCDLCEINPLDITEIVPNSKEDLKHQKAEVNPDIPEQMQEESQTVPHEAVDQLLVIKKNFDMKMIKNADRDRPSSRQTLQHDKLIKNVVWNRQRLQSTFQFFEESQKRGASFEYIQDTDIYKVFYKNDLKILNLLRTFELTCFQQCNEILEGKVKPEVRTNIVFNDEIDRYLIDGVIIEAIERRACINHTLYHRNHVKKLQENQIKVWEILKNIKNIQIPFQTLIEIYGNFYFCYTNCELGSLSMFQGSSSNGMLFEVVDDEVNNIAKEISGYLNIGQHKIYDYSMLDTKNVNLSCNSEIHRLKYSYENTHYFQYFPRVCDRCLIPDFNWIQKDMLNYDSYLGCFYLMRPELIMNQNNGRVKEGWIVCRWKEFIKCDQCKNIIQLDHFYQQEQDMFKTTLKHRRQCIDCQDKNKYRFDVPHDKVFYKTIPKKEAEEPQFQNRELGLKQKEPPQTQIRSNPDVLFFYDSLQSERERITEKNGNIEFLNLITENEHERETIKELSKILVEDNIPAFIEVFEDGQNFLKVTNFDFVDFLHNYAINVRQLVYIFDRTTSQILQELILIEILSRVLKEIIYIRINQNEMLRTNKNIKYQHNEQIHVTVKLVHDLYEMFDLKNSSTTDQKEQINNLTESQEALQLQMKEVCVEKFMAPVEFFRYEFNFQNLLQVFFTKSKVRIRDSFQLDQDYDTKQLAFNKSQIVSISPVAQTYKYQSNQVKFFLEFLDRMHSQIHKSLVEESKQLFLVDWYRNFFKETKKMQEANHEMHVKVAVNLCMQLMRLHNKGQSGIIEWNTVQRIEVSPILDEILDVVSSLLKNRIEKNCLIEFHSLDVISLQADLVQVQDSPTFKIIPQLEPQLEIFKENNKVLKLLMFAQYLSEVICGCYNLKICEILLKISQVMYGSDRCEEAAQLARKFMYNIALSQEEETTVYKYQVNQFNKIEQKVDSGLEQQNRLELIEKLKINLSNSMSEEFENDENALENENITSI